MRTVFTEESLHVAQGTTALWSVQGNGSVSPLYGSMYFYILHIA